MIGIFFLQYLQLLSKFPRADWLVAIVYKTTDIENDVRCKAALSEGKIKPIPPFTFFYSNVKNNSTAVIYGPYSYRP